MKKFSFLLLFCAAGALAQEPPYTYKQFSFTPQDYKGTLTTKQKIELNACLDAAKKQEDRAKASNQAHGDLFGVSVCDCLADDEHGKGWSVQEKTQNGWEDIPVRIAIRKLIGLD
jgi:hypothetical protein